MTDGTEFVELPCWVLVEDKCQNLMRARCPIGACLLGVCLCDKCMDLLN